MIRPPSAMASPADFPQQNGVFGAPPGHEGTVEALPIHRSPYPDGTPVIISCWHLSEAERAEVARTGKVWLHVWGRTHAPVYVGGESPFVQDADE